jgi:hypothetical protein
MAKRIFLVGNGPSLKDTPLELLKHEDTMGLNAIDLIYDKTTWRPTYYFCMDVNPNDRHRWQAVENNLGCKKLFLYDLWKERFQGDNIEYIPRCKKHHPFPVQSRNALQEWHLPTICTAHGSMSPMMQLAVQMGYEEIYLVGVDMFTAKHDHFDEHYPSYCVWEERNKILQHIHEVAQRSSPIPIYNASVGGYLEVHPRVNIFDLLAERTAHA